MIENKAPGLRVLVVDDEKNLRDSLVAFFGLEGIEAVARASAEEAEAFLRTEVVDAVVLDLRMPGMSGLEFLSRLRAEGPRCPVVMISAHGELADAVEAMKLGAADYLEKPFDPEELAVRLRRAVRSSRAEARMAAGERAPGSRAVRAAGALLDGGAADASPLGRDPAMREIEALIGRVAASNATVLVTGESGVGKEVVARLIHARSPRSDGPFVPINLGGVPDTLLESELFGWEPGAFTGAAGRKEGLLELASGGTLFLDEVGDLPLHLQVKLLRVLQDKKVQRLGSTRPLPIDARVVAATNKDLEAAVAGGTFREDLFYRLSVIRVRVPPLRERRGDVEALALAFAERFARETGKPVPGLDPSARALLSSYPFPGNVRELENAVERAVILGSGGDLSASDFSFAGERLAPAADAAGPGGEGSLDDAEKAAIEAALRRNGGHRERSARELGIARRTLLNKMRKYGLL